jgi:hypothetical protein
LSGRPCRNSIGIEFPQLAKAATGAALQNGYRLNQAGYTSCSYQRCGGRLASRKFLNHRVNCFLLFRIVAMVISRGKIPWFHAKALAANCDVTVITSRAFFRPAGTCARSTASGPRRLRAAAPYFNGAPSPAGCSAQITRFISPRVAGLAGRKLPCERCDNRRLII